MIDEEDEGFKSVEVGSFGEVGSDDNILLGQNRLEAKGMPSWLF